MEAVSCSRKLLRRLFFFVVRSVLVLLPERFQKNLYPHSFCGNVFFKKLIQPVLVAEYHAQDDNLIRARNRAWLWGSKAGKKWHEGKKKVYSDAFFANNRGELIEQIQILLKHGQYHVICEIGTGNGIFLDFLCRQHPQIDTFIGIDINADQIKENKTNIRNEKVTFVHGETDDFIRQFEDDHIVFVSCGTFECFTQKELMEFFSLVKERFLKAAIILQEPVQIDLQNQFDSVPRGNFAYSHNYPFLLRSVRLQDRREGNKAARHQERTLSTDHVIGDHQLIPTAVIGPDRSQHRHPRNGRPQGETERSGFGLSRRRH